MSYAVSDWAWEQECVPPPAKNGVAASAMKSVLTCLASYANKEGEQAFPSVATIARKTHLDERTVRKALGALVTVGMAERHERKAGNRLLSFEYRLNIREAPPANLSPPPTDKYVTPQPPANMPWDDPTPSQICASGVTNLGGNPVLEPSKEERTSKTSSSSTRVPARVAEVADVQRIVDAWNDMAKSTGLSVIRAMTDKRRRDLGARLREHGVDGILEAITAIGMSKFCHGTGATGWKADFDNLLQSKICARAREGKYADRVRVLDPNRLTGFGAVLARDKLKREQQSSSDETALEALNHG